MFNSTIVLKILFLCSQVPSCIAVSPEGTVRFWPSVAHEGTSVENSTDLQGQECDSLTSIASLGCILATTTSTVVHLQPEVCPQNFQVFNFNNRYSLLTVVVFP